MTRYGVGVGLLLPVLMLGCARDIGLSAVQADMVAVEWQSRTRSQTVEARMQELSDHLTQVEHAQVEIRRTTAQEMATLEALRIQLHHLQGEVQKIQRRAQRSATAGERGAAARLAHWERRLRTLATQLRVSRKANNETLNVSP